MGRGIVFATWDPAPNVDPIPDKEEYWVNEFYTPGRIFRRRSNENWELIGHWMPIEGKED